MYIQPPVTKVTQSYKPLHNHICWVQVTLCSMLMIFGCKSLMLIIHYLFVNLSPSNVFITREI